MAQNSGKRKPWQGWYDGKEKGLRPERRWRIYAAMKHPVHPCDEIRGVGPHHTRVALESLENLGDGSNRHPVETMEPDPVKASDVARATLIHFLKRFSALSPTEREVLLLRLWGMEWDAIAVRLNIASFQLAEWTFARALRKNPDLKTLFPKTNNNNLRVRAR